MAELSHGEAMVEIRKRGGDGAMSMVADYLDRSAEANQRLSDSILESVERERDEALAEVDRLSRHIRRIEERVMGLVAWDYEDFDRGTMGRPPRS